MATTKPTTPSPQLSERLGVVETKVENLNEKLDDIKETITENKKEVSEQLDKMYRASCEQHEELGRKFSELEKFKNKWSYLVMGAIAALGWAAGHTGALNLFK
jgi:chromosome segregation ATPase